MEVDDISLILLLGMFALLAIGMPLGFASAFLAVATLMMKFGPDLLLGDFGRGPFNVLGQAIYRQMTNYVLISVPLFIFMAACEGHVLLAECLAQPNPWRDRDCDLHHGGNHGRNVGHHRWRGCFTGPDRPAPDVTAGL